ncbi:MAG TPA: nuclear transport factor 2 family protein [Phenylobacterium sp.]|nr:nuclear transport factor 2 family protein [Phenylobacterium sp.]
MRSDENNSYLSVSAADRAAIEALCIEYAWRIDNGFAAQVPELFTDEATWEGPHGITRGRQELEALWTARAQRPGLTRHLISNIRLARSEQGVMQGWVSFTLLTAAPGAEPLPSPTLVADHIDTYHQREDGAWRFASRRVSAVFYEGQWAPQPLAR